MPRILFITGTDTGVGKTFVAAALTAKLRISGINAVAIKPIESGCEIGTNGAYIPADALVLKDASDNIITLEECNLYHLKAPLAPPIAAELEGIELSFTDVANHLKNLSPRFELVVVEGAGGLLTPFAQETTLADLAVAAKDTCAVSILIVVHSRLGAINHTALTIEALKVRGIHTMGIVLNEFGSAAEDEQLMSSNRFAIAKIALTNHVPTFSLKVSSQKSAITSPALLSFCEATTRWMAQQ